MWSQSTCSPCPTLTRSKPALWFQVSQAGSSRSFSTGLRPATISFDAQVQGLERPPGALDARPVRMGLRAAFAQVRPAVNTCMPLLLREQI